MADAPLTDAFPVTPGTSVPRGRAYRIACTTDGYFRLIMANGSFYDVFATRGQGGEDGISIVGVAATGTPSPAGVGIVTVLTGRAV
jgi:hypothetical protein